MKPPSYLIATIAMFGSAFFLPDPTQAQQTSGPVVLDSLRDRNRVFIAYLPPTEAAKAEQFRKLWADASAHAGVRERDGVLIEFTDLKAQPDAARRLELREGQFAFALIGKDGHVAYRTSEPVEPVTVFARIDGMPMRRDEMKARGQGSGKP